MSTPAELHWRRERLICLQADLAQAKTVVDNALEYGWSTAMELSIEAVAGNLKASIFRMTIAGDISADAVGAHKMKRLAP